MKIIFAHDLNGGIGLKNKLPWCITEDMRFFKKKIKNKITVAGRITFNSVPFKVSKLFTGDVDELRKEYKSFYVIGGAKTYESVVPFLQKGDTIYETKIYGRYEADSFFSYTSLPFFGKEVIFDGICEEKKYGGRVRIKITKKKII
jgi:dihydrofolate reductase